MYQHRQQDVLHRPWGRPHWLSAVCRWTHPRITGGCQKIIARAVQNNLADFIHHAGKHCHGPKRSNNIRRGCPKNLADFISRLVLTNLGEHWHYGLKHSRDNYSIINFWTCRVRHLQKEVCEDRTLSWRCLLCWPYWKCLRSALTEWWSNGVVHSI